MNVVDKFSNQTDQEKNILDKLNDMIDGENTETNFEDPPISFSKISEHTTVSAW